MAKEPQQKRTPQERDERGAYPRWAIIRSVSPMGTFRRAEITFERKEVAYALNGAAQRETPACQLLTTEQWKRIRAESMLAARETDDINEALEAAPARPEITMDDLRQIVLNQADELAALKRDLLARSGDRGPAPVDARIQTGVPPVVPPVGTNT